MLEFGKPLSEAVPYPRLHHQLNPNHVTVEKEFPERFRKGLEERHHKVHVRSSEAVPYHYTSQLYYQNINSSKEYCSMYMYILANFLVFVVATCGNSMNSGHCITDS